MNKQGFVFSILIAVASLCMMCAPDFDINQPGDKLFTKIPAAHSQVNFENRLTQTRENNHLLNVEFVSGGGVAVGDINGDGLHDLFFTGNQVRDRLYLNKGNFIFEDITVSANISDDNQWSTGVTFVDIDADGDQDIYVCRFVYLENDKSANQLYINNGDLTFTEKAEEFGLADKGFSTQAVFFDYDKDNLLDMYLVNQPPSIPGRRGQIGVADLPDIIFSDRLYKNKGNRTFEDQTENAGVRNFGFGLSATVGDVNNDGWPDVYVSNDFSVADHLYINQKDGSFADEIQTATRHITHFSMGSDIADYDNDGFLDIAVVDMVPEDPLKSKSHMTSIEEELFINTVQDGGHYQYMMNTLQRNNGNGTFSELARMAGMSKTSWSWAPLFADFDHDGFKDLFISNGVLSNNLHSDLADIYDRKLDSTRRAARMRNIDPKQMIDVFDFVPLAAIDKLPNYIFRNNGNYTFSNKVMDWGFEEPTTSNGAAYADLDLDGDLDIVINNVNDNAMVYRNNAIEMGQGGYLQVRLKPAPGRTAIGARVKLYRDNKLWQMVDVANTRGFRSASTNLVHFGVAQEEKVEKVVVEWPDATISVLEKVAANQILEVEQQNAEASDADDSSGIDVWFSDVSSLLNLEKIAYRQQNATPPSSGAILPYNLSRSGPCIGVGDVNNDGRDDFFVGGATGHEGQLFMQQVKGTFTKRTGPWIEDAACEDSDVVFMDVDQDQDMDIIIASGGYEIRGDDAVLQDRIYINDGTGKFKKSDQVLPEHLGSASCLVPNDYDKDGDIDLFVGEKVVPGKYPFPASSRLLENRGGRLFDVTSEQAPQLNKLGLVTAASWSDQNMDGLDDLVLVGEWMPVTVFIQDGQGHFDKMPMNGLEDTEGWYFALSVHDMDGDGDEDLIAGNMGLNYTYRASIDDPFEVFAADFDRNGSIEVVFSYEQEGKRFPLEGLRRSSKQMPSLSKKFNSHESFGTATLEEIYGAAIGDALHLKAKTFASLYIENLGNSTYKVLPLPSMAQISSTNSIIPNDFNEDGFQDLLIGGNLYDVDLEVPRNDAGNGLLLLGDGKGGFAEIPTAESGLFTPNDVRDMKVIGVDGKHVLLVGNNNSYLQAFELNPIID